MNYDADFRSRRSNVLATRGMVAASQPLAAQAGLAVLKSGGNAADAAVAVSAMLGVVEPISTGIGGDLFVLYWDAEAKRVSALNGSGRAAAGASIEELLKLGYAEMPGYTGHAVSVPGTVAGWSDLLARHGSMPLADLLQAAIWTAENGFPVSELIARGWASQPAKLLRRPEWHSGDLDDGPEQPSGNELLIDGRAPRAGELMHMPAMAQTLRGIAAEGRDYIYRGKFATKLSEHVQRYGGWITPADMAAHRSTWDTPITANYRGVTLYECPPNGQGLAAILALNLASGFDLASMSKADRLHTMVECMRLAFADAQQWVCDISQVDIPLDELCSSAYAAERRRAIDSHRAAQAVPFGNPGRGGDTVYFCTADGRGNACSFINSLYMGTGSGLVVPGTGISLQNRAALFRLDPEHPNALAPNKRPYQTIIPAMTTRDGELDMAFGVMGGFMQPQGHFQVLVNILDLGMEPQEALDMPRWRLMVEGGGLGAREPGGLLLVEGGADTAGWHFATMAELTRRGHRLAPVDGFGRGTFGGGQIIVRDPESGVLTAGSDPRKDGCAVGY